MRQGVKMRRMKLNHEQFVVIFMAAFILTTGAGYFWYMGTIDDSRFRYAVNTPMDGIYRIEVVEADGKYLQNIRFKVVDPEGAVVFVTDPDGNFIALEGTLWDIWYDENKSSEARNQQEWPDAHPTPPQDHWSRFYADYPDAKNNLTLFLVYYDMPIRNEYPNGKVWYVRDRKLTEGDHIEIRSDAIGGGVYAGCKLKLYDPHRNDDVVEITFKRAVVPIDVSIYENQGDYRIKIVDCEPWPIDDVSYQLLTYNFMQNRWEDPSGEIITMLGSLEDIVYTHEDFSSAISHQNHTKINTTYRGIFYSREPAGGPPISINHTFATVYFDSDSDGLVTSGDTLWVRGSVNGGAVDEWDGIRLGIRNWDQTLIRTPMIRTNFEIDYNVTIVNGSYRVDLLNASGHSMDEIEYTLYDGLGKNVSLLDPDHRRIDLEGDLIDINFTLHSYNSADNEHPPVFYSRDPVGMPPRSINHTLFIVFEDMDLNGRMTTGDKIWVRSAAEGGAADSDFTLVLRDQRYDKSYSTITFS